MRLSQQQVTALVKQARKKSREAFDAMKEEKIQQARTAGELKSEAEVKNEAIKYRNQLLILPDFILKGITDRESHYSLEAIEGLIEEEQESKIDKEMGEFDFDSQDFENQIWIASIESSDMQELMRKLPLLNTDNPDQEEKGE